jgi:hypothetical protein
MLNNHLENAGLKVSLMIFAILISSFIYIVKSKTKLILVVQCCNSLNIQLIFYFSELESGINHV